MLLNLLALASAFILGRTVRDTLFLYRVPLAHLPWVYILVAISVSLAAYAYGRVADRYRRDRLAQAMLLAFAGLCLGFWLLIRLHILAWLLVPALYVLIEVMGALAIIQFWTLATDVFSSRQGRRVFGVIGAGAVLANIVCGLLIRTLGPSWVPSDLLLVVAALFAFSAVLVRQLAGLSPEALSQSLSLPDPSTGEQVALNLHMMWVALMVALTFVTVTVVDYQFKLLVKAAYPSETELASYFGLFYLVTGVIASLMQFILTGRILERGGVILGLAILPLSLLFGASLVFMVPWVSGLAAASLIRGSENVFRYTVHDASMQLLYAPVPQALRARTKALIDGMVKPLSIGGAGLLLWWVARGAPSTQLAVQLSWVDFGLGISWLLLLVFGVRPNYLKSLIETLKQRRSDWIMPWTPVLDETTLQLLKTELRSDDEHELISAIDLLPKATSAFESELLTLLRHPSASVRIRALQKLSTSGNLHAIRPLFAVLKDRSATVRAQAIQTLSVLGGDEGLKRIQRYLHDPTLEVRAASVSALMKHGGLDGILMAADSFKALLESPDPKARCEAARVLREVGNPSLYRPILTLLQDEVREVEIAAIEAAGASQSQALVPALIYKLAHYEVAPAAAEALQRYGHTVKSLLIKVLANTQENLAIRRRVPRILAALGGQDALEALLSQLETRDENLRHAITRACARLSAKDPTLQVDFKRLSQAIDGELRRVYQLLSLSVDLQLDPSEPLAEALAVRRERGLKLALRLVAIRHPDNTLHWVNASLDSQEKRTRENALEVADAMLSRDEARLLLPLLERPIPHRQLQLGREAFGLSKQSPAAGLSALLADTHPWTVACALDYARRHAEIRPELPWKRFLFARDPVVRETALLVLVDRAQPNAPQVTDPSADPWADPPAELIEAAIQKGRVDPHLNVQAAALALEAAIARTDARLDLEALGVQRGGHERR